MKEECTLRQQKAAQNLPLVDEIVVVVVPIVEGESEVSAASHCVAHLTVQVVEVDGHLVSRVIPHFEVSANG